MNLDAVLAIAEKDVREVGQSTQMLLPLLVVPLVFVVVLPAGVILLPQYVPIPESEYAFVGRLLGSLPADVQAVVAPLSLEQQFVYLAVTYLFSPLFLVVPLMVSNIIAASSFAGEKERGTIEGLLYAPVSNTELFVGKVLAAFVPAIVVAVVGFVGYVVVVDALTYEQFGRLLLPNTLWLVLILWIVPAVSIFGLGVTVLVSMKARGFQEAQQIAGVVVLPIVALVLAQVTGVLFLSTGLLVAIGALVFVLDAVLVWAGVRAFEPETLLTGGA